MTLGIGLPLAKVAKRNIVKAASPPLWGTISGGDAAATLQRVAAVDSSGSGGRIIVNQTDQSDFGWFWAKDDARDWSSSREGREEEHRESGVPAALGDDQRRGR